ncbi:hypothetical protein V8E54_012234 [Elaphomyces granulatus]
MGDRHSSRSKRPRRASISVDNRPVDHDIDHPVDHHAGSLDEDPAAAFSNISTAHEKIAHVAKLLKEWHWGFSTLVKQWLTFKDGQQETTYRELKKHSLLVESMELATTFVVNGIRDEFAVLRDTMLFGRWDPELDFEQLNLSKAATKLQSEAPLFTYLITKLAQNQRESDNSYKRQADTGYVVMIMSILLLKFARNSANSSARMLGYLQGSGIKRWSLQYYMV